MTVRTEDAKPEKVDVVDLAETIYGKIIVYNNLKRSMGRRWRRSERKTINTLVDKYNKIIGFSALNIIS